MWASSHLLFVIIFTKLNGALNYGIGSWTAVFIGQAHDWDKLGWETIFGLLAHGLWQTTDNMQCKAIPMISLCDSKPPTRYEDVGEHLSCSSPLKCLSQKLCSPIVACEMHKRRHMETGSQIQYFCENSTVLITGCNWRLLVVVLEVAWATQDVSNLQRRQAQRWSVLAGSGIYFLRIK